MPLRLRKIVWTDGTSRDHDFSVIDERGFVVGRIMRILAAGPEPVWTWNISEIAIRNRWTPNVHGGRADTLDEAKAAFRAAWERCEPGERGA